MSHLDGEALLRWFLEHGGSANGVPSDPGAPLRRARTPAMAALLLKHGATLRYTSALHAATLRHSDSEAIPLMQFLLENVVDIDELQYEGRHNRPREAGSNDHGTALHVAAKEGSVERARMLAESGADMGKRSKNGFTARDGAQLREKDEVKLFLEGCMREKGLEVKELIEEDYNDEYGDGIRNVR